MNKLPFRDYHLLQLLSEINEKEPLDETVRLYFKSHKALGSKDRREISEAFYHLIKWQETYDYFLKPPITWENRFELFKSQELKKLLLDPSLPPHIQVGFNKELYEILFNSLQDNTKEFCLTCQKEAPITVRVNPEKSSLEAFQKRFPESRKCAMAPFGFTFPKREALTATLEYQTGCFELQDEGSQLLAELVDAKPYDTVIDYCAGSGGKTLGFAYKLQKKGAIYLNDIRPQVLNEAERRVLRAGIEIAHIGLDPHKKADWILVDVPCSATGTLRRHPEQKSRLTKSFIDNLALKQRAIFKEALLYLKPNGKIVYATCSVLKEENEEQLDFFLKNYPLKLVSPPFQSLPKQNEMDGFYAVVLQFNTDSPII